MNSITDDFKRNLAERYQPRPHQSNQNYKPSTNNTQMNSQHKFMQHFQSINSHPIAHKIDNTPLQDYSTKFAQTIQQYKTQSSMIDQIVESNDDAEQISKFVQKYVEAPTLPQVKATLMEQLKHIGMFFQGREEKDIAILVNSDYLLQLETYSTALNGIGQKNKANQAKNQLKNKLVIKEPTVAAAAPELKQIQVDTLDLQLIQKQQSERMKKVDLILMELVKEKKRKNYVSDYFYIMEMKLMELLDFILQDEQEYIGLDASTKTKLVLKNLQSFQGKLIEGQSKINLLRIFFEQFTTLKKEKEHQQAITPMKKLQNKEKVNNTKSKDISAKKWTAVKAKKQPSHQNQRSDKRSVKSKQDEWIGRLNN